MKIKRVYFLVFILLSLTVSLAFGQEQATLTAPESSMPPPAEPQWVWAEVVSVDIVNSQMSIKYLDYETDTEKEMVVSVDYNTTYENAKSLDEIKPQDTVSIDYITTAEGKNIAKNINVEKIEGIQAVGDETIKAEPQPTAATTPQSTNTDKEAKPAETSSSQEENPVSQMQE